MIVQYSSSFIRTIKRLPNDRKDKIKKAIADCIAFYEFKVKTPGLGLKRLHKDIWEIRASIKDRVVFLLFNNTIRFVICGDHDDIDNFLKHY